MTREILNINYLLLSPQVIIDMVICFCFCFLTDALWGNN